MLIHKNCKNISSRIVYAHAIGIFMMMYTYLGSLGKKRATQDQETSELIQSYRLEDLNTHPKGYRLLQGSLLWLHACMLTPSAHLVFTVQEVTSCK